MAKVLPMFPEAIWLICGTEDYEQSISDFYCSVTKEMIDKKKQAAMRYAQQLILMQEKTFQEIIQYCRSV